MPQLKFSRHGRFRRFESVKNKDKRIEFQRLTSSIPRGSFVRLLIMAGIIIYLFYYLSKV